MRRIVGVCVVSFTLAFLSNPVSAHTPPLVPEPAELCALLEKIPDCEAWLAELIEERMARIAEDAHKRTVSRRAPTSSTYRGMGTDVEKWRPLVAQYWAAETVDRALCVIAWESGGNPNAKNPTSSARGLFQILASLWAPEFGVSYDDLYLPDLNVALARRIFDAQGWGAWQAINRGKC